MVCLSPMVVLEGFAIASNVSCSFRVSFSAFSIAIFPWYPTEFDVYLDSRRSWWVVVKYYLKLSHVFCFAGFLLQILKLSLKITVL